MAKYRHDLPQLNGGTFLSDGGMETTLIFHDGVELPHFASFVADGNRRGPRDAGRILRELSRHRAQAGRRLRARQRRPGAPIRTGRAKLGYGAAALKAVNAGSIAFLRGAREVGKPGDAIVSSAVRSARAATATRPASMDADEAEDYHAPQIEAFAEAGADMITAFTLNTVNEAIGIARAARRPSACRAPFRSRWRPTVGL